MTKDHLQNEFMDFWHKNKDTLGLGKYSDDVADFWLSKLDTYANGKLEEAAVKIDGRKMGYYSPKNAKGLPLEDIMPKRLGAMSYNDALQTASSIVREAIKKEEV